MDETRVVVSGMGVVCAIAGDVEELAEGLREGRDGISKIEAFVTDDMRSHHAGEIKRRLEVEPTGTGAHKPLDRNSALALRAGREALASSGLEPTADEEPRIGVAMGSCGGGYLNGLSYLGDTREGRGRGNLLLDLPLHAAASRLAGELGAGGGIQVVSNACASSAIAVSLAFDRIRTGQAVAMVVGGYDALSPLNCAGFGVMRNSSLENRLRPFDKNRDGMLLGEGAAVLILESRAHCRGRGGPVLAEILGYGISTDTYHLTAPDPSGRGAAAALEAALACAGVAAEEIDYVNAHGTGTIYNDRMECAAIHRVFGERARRLPMSSTKSMIGHTLGAAGAIELVTSIVGMNGGFLPPTIHFETPDPRCDIDCVPNEARPASIERLVSNSFGFGGTNCSLVVGRA